MTSPMITIHAFEAACNLVYEYRYCYKRSRKLIASISDCMQTGFSPNPELAKEYEEKLNSPDIPINPDGMYRNRVEQINDFVMSLKNIEALENNLMLIAQFNCHNAIQEVIKVFRNGLKPREIHYDNKIKEFCEAA